MPELYRIHGDNIVECEQIMQIILSEIRPRQYDVSLASPSVLAYTFDFEYNDMSYSWEIQLLPGFNKANRNRWEKNIFSVLRENGSFLDETPDAIITYVDEYAQTETILCAIELCSALQAGNQAWQRSGRAFSTGRTGCPYIYRVEFVKYELDPNTRERKALRFPNPAVPYSYINFALERGTFVAQVYVRSEEFNPSYDPSLVDFDENDFAGKDLSAYIVKLMCGLNTSDEEQAILSKNFNVVLFLSTHVNPRKNFTSEEWKRLLVYRDGIIRFSVEETRRFNFSKTITQKSHHGNSRQFLNLVEEYSVGLASQDLPMGIIPATNRRNFAHGLQKIYPDFDASTIDMIGSEHNDLILCVIKGFKPRGDDNRPDRGILPFASMLTSTDVEVMTYMYGPLLSRNYNLLLDNPIQLANINGLWRSVLSLTNYLALDVPILSGAFSDASVLLNTTPIKEHFIENTRSDPVLSSPYFPCIPIAYHEDDVDTGIHFIFSHLLHEYCFEGMCNPPGGDWSGLSIIVGDDEVRWLSLPRVSAAVNGKRPDHVLELFGVFQKPLLLAIESKERSSDLEPDVGIGLINYITNLLSYIPNVKRKNRSKEDWQRANHFVDPDQFIYISAAAYLKDYAQPETLVFGNSSCDLLIVMEPTAVSWNLYLYPHTYEAEILKNFIQTTLKKKGSTIQVF